jgi:glutathione-independent formaldehyde dehydrogenase
LHSGGQAEYLLVPYADFQLLKLPKEVAMSKITSLAFLSDILPTGYNGAVQAGVGVGSIVYIAGAGPVGLCCAKSCFLLGAAEVIISDQKADRLALAAQIGCKTIDLTKLKGGSHDALAIHAEIVRLLPSWKNGPHDIVDCSVDCVGYECCGVGKEAEKRIDEQVLNTCIHVTKAGGGVGIPGLYPPADLGGPNADNKQGLFHLNWGMAWNKVRAGGGCGCVLTPCS